ncbi:MAG TPA: hypothetical protein VIU46_03155 [Gallionellaceae bacterium]
MKLPVPHPRFFGISLWLIAPLALLLAYCGGGGGSSSSPPAAPNPPVIAALLFGFPAGAAPGNFPNALVAVVDSTTGAALTNATVTINGAPLFFNGAPTNNEFEGTVLVNPGDPVTLVVSVNGQVYSASGMQPTTYPTITAPASGATWSFANANTVTWTAGAPLAGAAYLVGVLNASFPIGSPAYFAAASSSATSLVIPASLLTPGNRILIVGLTLPPIAVSNAYPGSLFIPGGFNYVPILVN